MTGGLSLPTTWLCTRSPVDGSRVEREFRIGRYSKAGSLPTTARAASRPPLPVETAILDGFRAVLDREIFGAGQVGDAPGDLEHPVMTAGGEPQAGHRPGQKPPG